MADTDRMLKEERQQLILDVIQKQKRVTVPELSSMFGISEVTIRRDLHDLAVSGKLQRTHRGAIEALPAPPEPPVIQRMAQATEYKQRIARAAAGMINEGESIFLGSGSTTMLLARKLVGHPLRMTVVTNALNIAAELAPVDDIITVVVTGGVLRGDELSVLGHIAEQSLQEVRVDKVFMGAQALSIEGGWSTEHMPEVPTTRRIIDMSQHLILLADHTKLDRRAAAFIAPVRRISTLITDTEADSEFVTRASGMGVRVVQV
jgi:DeoR family transcriptional regulator of aga operon/DeoR family fructose operon transcriptional repressor